MNQIDPLSVWYVVLCFFVTRGSLKPDDSNGVTHITNEIELPEGSRYCSKCSEIKDESEFVKLKHKTTTRFCLLCNREYHKKYRSINDSRLRATYDMPYKEYQRRAKEPCPICNRSGRKMCVDHDHATGRARGVLCTTCNRALGLLGDTSENVQKALTYLNMLTGR